MLFALMYVVVVMDRDWLVLIEKVDPSGIALALELVLLQGLEGRLLRGVQPALKELFPVLRAGVGIGLLDRGRFSLGTLVVKQFLALLIDYLGMGWLLMRAVVLLMLGMQMGLGWLLGCLLKLLKGLVLLLSTGERLGW